MLLCPGWHHGMAHDGCMLHAAAAAAAAAAGLARIASYRPRARAIAASRPPPRLGLAAAMMQMLFPLLSLAHTAAASTCPLTVTKGHCCPGGDAIGDMPSQGTAECCDLCHQKENCSTFTFNYPQKRCYLKASVPYSQAGQCDCGHAGALPPKKPAPSPAKQCASQWAQYPGVGCAARGGAGAGGWQVPAVDAQACCTICTQGESGPGHPKCSAWTYLPYSYHANGVCIMSAVPDCQAVDSPTGTGAVGACDPSHPKCTPPRVPGPPTCKPVHRPSKSALSPLPTGVATPPHIVTLLVDDLGFDDLRSHDHRPGSASFSPTIATLLEEGVLLNRHHTYMWCSPTRRSFITGRYLVHITGEQAATDTNLTPLQFTILSEKLAAANYENHFLGKGHMGWQTTDHLLVSGASLLLCIIHREMGGELLSVPPTLIPVCFPPRISLFVLKTR